MVISVGCARIKLNRLGKIGDAGAPFGQGIIGISAGEIGIDVTWIERQRSTTV